MQTGYSSDSKLYFHDLSFEMQQLISKVDENIILAKKCVEEIEPGHANKAMHDLLEQFGFCGDIEFAIPWLEDEFYERIEYDADRFHDLILRMYSTQKEDLLLALRGEIFSNPAWNDSLDPSGTRNKLRLDTLAILANLGGTILTREVARRETNLEIEDRIQTQEILEQELHLSKQRLEELKAPGAMKAADDQTGHSLMIIRTQEKISELESHIKFVQKEIEVKQELLERDRELMYDSEYMYGLKTQIFKVQKLLDQKFAKCIVDVISGYAWVDGNWYQKKRPRAEEALNSTKRLRTTQ